MNEKYYGYIYKITNLINNKSYIGQHKSTVFDPHYWGSGVLITKALKKYGKENFYREVLEWCLTLKALNEAEIKWISIFNTVSEGYNVSLGGGGVPGVTLNEEQRMARSEQTRRWFSNPENRLRQSLSHKGHVPSNKGQTAQNNEVVRNRVLNFKARIASGELKPGMLGKRHSKETIIKQSRCKLGELNPFYGHHHSEQLKTQMGAKLKGHLTSEETRRKISIANSGSNNGMYGKVPKNAGKICITNGITNKYISPNELSEFIEEGWVKGSTQHPRKKSNFIDH